MTMKIGKIVALCTISLVTVIVSNIITRPEYVSVPVELPKPKPVTAIYEFGPDEDFPEHWDRPAYIEGQDDFVVDNYDEPTPLYTKKDLNCLALNIYFEAYEESIKGQLAVGLVTLNRVNSPHFPNSVCEVVYQHKQFSWYWDGKSDRPKYPKKYETARLLASSLLDPESQIYDYTYGSDHYHADYVDPYWRHGMIKIVKIDTHIFYRNDDYDNRIL